MNREHQRIESLLEQMPLNQPSGSLDQQIAQICDDAQPSVQLSQPSSNRWLGLLSVVLVASLSGFLLGQFVQLKPNDAQGSPIANLGGSTPMISATLTPVKFNVNAFRLLHRHSELPVYAQCKDCHSDDGPPKAFEDWYYGDQDFFAAHQSGNMSNCSSCHTVDALMEKVDPALPTDFKHFKEGNCSACHVVEEKPKKPGV